MGVACALCGGPITSKLGVCVKTRACKREYHRRRGGTVRSAERPSQPGEVCLQVVGYEGLYEVLTLSGQPLTIPADTGNGGSHTATENYSVATNDSNGYYAEVAGDTSSLNPQGGNGMPWPTSTCGSGGAAYPNGWETRPPSCRPLRPTAS